MGDAGDQRTLGLKVTNFGPIVEADVELRPLTVFVGPSNTGKSYLAILIYALHQLFERDLDPIQVSLPSLSDEDPSHAPLDHDLPTESVDALSEWLEQLAGEPEPDSLATLPGLPIPAADRVRDAMRSGDALSSAFRTGLARCFGVGSAVAQLIRSTSKGGSRIIVGRRQMRDESELSSSPHIQHEISIHHNRKQPYEFKTSVPVGADLRLSTHRSILLIASMFRAMRRVDEIDDSTAFKGMHWANDLIASLRNIALARSAGPLSRRAYYLPADRTGVMHAHRAVVGAVIDRASRAGIDDAPNVPTLSGVMSDFLRDLIRIGDEKHPAKGAGDALASILERDVLDGAVAVEHSETNYPTFVYRPTGLNRDFPIMTSSSMVSELAPVVLYLRHYVKPGNTLIIEEPESHLHPAMQAEFALHLVRLVHAGVRVIVTTHSEWILDQFANLVRLSDLSEKEREDLRGGDAALSANDIGFWLFKPNAKRRGSVVQELKVDPEAGGLLSGYDEVAEQLYNEWAEIGNRIADRGAE